MDLGILSISKDQHKYIAERREKKLRKNMTWHNFPWLVQGQGKRRNTLI
jgi:hypothetical protein